MTAKSRRGSGMIYGSSSNDLYTQWEREARFFPSVVNHRVERVLKQTERMILRDGNEGGRERLVC